MPLFTSSLIMGHDTFFYFTRVVELHQNVIHGIFFPRWAPDMHFGAGQPLFLFHPPMFYWLAEVWHLLGLPVVTAVNLACAVVVFVSAAGAFLLGRLYFGRAGGFLASAAYIYAPYFATNLYIRSALEEFTAFAFLPLALFGFGAYAKRLDIRYLLLGAGAYAGLVLSHLPATLLFTPLLLGVIAITAKTWRVLLTQATGFLLALGLSACVWVPVLLERQFVSLDRAAQGYGEYANHFVYLRQLIYSAWGYGYSVPGPDDGMPFAVGWNHVLAAGAAWLWVEWRMQSRWIRLLRFLVVASSVFCVLMLRIPPKSGSGPAQCNLSSCRGACWARLRCAPLSSPPPSAPHCLCADGGSPSRSDFSSCRTSSTFAPAQCRISTQPSGPPTSSPWPGSTPRLLAS
jgi:hypothetical protein